MVPRESDACNMVVAGVRGVVRAILDKCALLPLSIDGVVVAGVRGVPAGAVLHKFVGVFKNCELSDSSKELEDEVRSGVLNFGLFSFISCLLSFLST